ncbi:MAG: hypothetical protein ACMXYD_00565 [Candidatus Woesearchaeota archaeon]
MKKHWYVFSKLVTAQHVAKPEHVYFSNHLPTHIPSRQQATILLLEEELAQIKEVLARSRDHPKQAVLQSQVRLLEEKIKKKKVGPL